VHACVCVLFHSLIFSLNSVRSPCGEAAANGNLVKLQWLHDNGCPIPVRVFDLAIGNGHFDMLKWLYVREFRGDVYSCATAAKVGRLDILQWLRETHTDWNELTCSYAAAG